MVGLIDVAVHFPEGYQTSEDLAALSGIPGPVIAEKFGLLGKHVAGPDEHVSDLALGAARALMARHPGVKLDAVIYFGSPFKDYPVWMVAPKIQHLLPAPGAAAFEIASVSAGFPVALRAAADMLAANARWEHVLLVGGCVESRLIDYANARSRFMFNFGDGGAAALLRKGASNTVLASHMLTDGSFHEFVKVPAGGSVEPASAESVAAGRHSLDVSDPLAMKEGLDPISLPNFVKVTKEAVEASGHSMADIGLLLPLHTKRSLYLQLLSELGLSESQGVYLDRFGHMSALDPLVGLHEAQRQGKLPEPGKLVVFLSAGTGYTWAATCLKWGA